MHEVFQFAEHNFNIANSEAMQRSPLNEELLSIETGETRETADSNLCCNSFETKYISSDSDPNQMKDCRSCDSITESHSPPVHPFEYHSGKAMESICTSHSSGGGCFSEAHAGGGKRWFEASDQSS